MPGKHRIGDNLCAEIDAERPDNGRERPRLVTRRAVRMQVANLALVALRVTCPLSGQWVSYVCEMTTYACPTSYGEWRLHTVV